jgi:transcriptional regulator with XRE-family HTH domain
MLATVSTLGDTGHVPTIKVASLGEFIREQRQHAQVSLRQLAKSAGVSNPYLSQVERGLKKPSAEILQQIAKGLRISAETLYVQAGFLEERGAASDVVGAILADKGLEERQKRVLLDVYDSFRRENVAIESRPAVAKNAATRTTTKKSTVTKTVATKKSPAEQTASTAVRTTATRRKNT